MGSLNCRVIRVDQPGPRHWVNLNWLWFTAFVGANLFQSALTRWCLMEDILCKVGIAKKAA
jgi:hypothetical protein